MCRIDDGERCEVWTETEHKARKQHRCTECSRDIMPGERYRRIFTVYSGDVTTYRQCAHCMVGADWLGKNCGGYITTEVVEEIHEHAREYGLMPLARFTVGAGRHWQRFGSKELMPVPAALPALALAH